MLHIIWTLIIGFIVGFVAKNLLHQGASLGLLLTSLLGIGGSFVGGLIGRAISKPKDGSAFHPAGIIMSIICAMLLLYVYTHFVH